MLLRIIITITILASSLGVAGTVGSSAVHPAWSFGARALYLKPSFGGNSLGYGVFSNYGVDALGNQVAVSGASNNISNLVPNWGWGFQIEGAYFITPTSDIDVNWYHFSRDTAGRLPSHSLYAGSAGGLFSGPMNVAPRWDAVNVEAGQYFAIQDNKSIRIHVGVAFARVNNEFQSAPQLQPDGISLFIISDAVTYNGFGPHLGADFGYTIGYGLGLYAKGAGSLLVGTAGQTISGYTNYLSAEFPYSSGNYAQSNNGVVVPELEANMGLKYVYTIADGELKFDVGYMWVNYLNVIVSQVGVGVVGSSISTSTSANFDMNGLYFGLQWTGYV